MNGAVSHTDQKLDRFRLRHMRDPLCIFNLSRIIFRLIYSPKVAHASMSKDMQPDTS